MGLINLLRAKFDPFTEKEKDAYSDALIHKEQALKYRDLNINIENLLKIKLDGKKIKGYDKKFKKHELACLTSQNISPDRIKYYDKRFDAPDLVYFIRKNIPPEIANKYDGRFNGYSLSRIAELKNAFPEKANKYDEKYSGWAIYNLMKSRCSPRTANRYNKRFSQQDVNLLVDANISPGLADKYNKRFSATSIKNLVESGCSPQKADKYDKKFGGWVIAELFEANCSPTKADKYNKRFKKDIAINGPFMEFVHAGVSPEIANKYSKKIREDEIYNLIKKGISPESADSYVSGYSKRFDETDRAQLIDNNISPETANKYSASRPDVIKLIKARVSPEQAEKYDKKFWGGDIIEMIKSNISLEKANSYAKKSPKRFIGEDIVKLIKAKVSLDKAKKYPKDLYGLTIANLIKAGISPERTKNYSMKFDRTDIEDLARAGCPPEIANKYHERFSGNDAALLFSVSCHPGTANNYPEKFDGLSIAYLFEAKVPLKELEKYDLETGHDIAVLHAIKITPEIIASFTKKKKRNVQTLFKRITKSDEIMNEDVSHPKYSFIDTGSSSVVLLKKNSAWKFSQNIQKEANLLSKLKNPKYVIKIKGKPKENIALKLEYIRGGTLESIIQDKPLKNKSNIMKYGYDVFRGLEELKQEGIYHRDIRPSNIMINEENDRAVIIDLGIATDNPNALPKDNRRYGGSDLMSLGQLMYKMYTGHNLFNEYSKPSLKAADKIERLRNDFCYDEEARKNYLKKITDNVKDEKIKNAIKTCLNAGLEIGLRQNLTPKQLKEEAYSRVKKMFEEHAR